MAQVPATSYESTSLGDVAEFTIPFPFLSRAEVFVTVDGAPVAFTWINDGLVQLAEVPELGAIVRRYRSTEAYVPLHQFSQGVPFLPRYVDRDFKQTLYAVQESVNDTAGTAAQALATAEESLVLVQDAFDILGERTQYMDLGPYAAGLEFQTTSQVFSYLGEFYAPGPAITLPYTTTGAGAGEIANFRSVGDATLRSDLAALGGAKHVLGAVRYCDTIADMRLLLAREANDTVTLAGSLAEAAPGQFYWSPSSTATDDGRSVVAVTGVATGRWLRAPVLTTMRNILEFIPHTEWAAIEAGTSYYDCSAAMEMANTLKCVLYAPHGTYRFTQPFLVKHDSVGIVGEGWRSTVFEYTPGNVSAAIGNATPATTKLFTRFSDFLLSTPQALTSVQADGFQFSSWERVWVYGSGLAGSIGIDLFSTWAVTEATYNKFDHLYIGNTKTAGIRIRDGANTNLLTRVRCQPAGGAGFLLAQLTGAGRCQNNTLQSCSSEFPGNVSNGVQIGVGVTDTTVVGCRFESMNNGIGDEGVRTVAHEWGNYFDSCTRNKLGPTTTDQAPEVFGCCTFDGTGATGSKTPSHARNLTATKTATGVYRVNWTVKPLNGASVNVSSSADLTILTGQDADGITFATQTVGKVAVDAPRIVVTVHT